MKVVKWVQQGDESESGQMAITETAKGRISDSLLQIGNILLWWRKQTLVALLYLVVLILLHISSRSSGRSPRRSSRRTSRRSYRTSIRRSSDATPGTSKHSAPLSESNHPAAPANRYFMWREISGVHLHRLFMWRKIYIRTMKNIRCAPASSVPARSSCWTACNSSVSCLQCKLHAEVNVLTSLTLQRCNQAGKDLSCSARWMGQ